MEPKSSKKGIKVVVDFGLPFAGLTLDRVHFDAHFDAHVSLAQLPQGSAIIKKSDHVTTAGPQTRDPTRRGPEACEFYSSWGPGVISDR